MLAFYMSFIDDDDDKKKFEMLYNLYGKRMARVAFSVLKNKEDAEDAVQDTFVKIARNMRSIGEPNSTETLSYVLKATKNTAINLSQKNTIRNKYIQLEDVENMTDNSFWINCVYRKDMKRPLRQFRALMIHIMMFCFIILFQE